MTLENTLRCARINAPELRKHKKFIEWLNAKSAGHGEDEPLGFTPANPHARVATWHTPTGSKPTPPGEYSDIFIWIDHGEGSDDDMPEDVWKNILGLVGNDFHGIVWMSFLEYP